MSNKFIQSFYQYPVTFSSLHLTVPARSAQGEMRNIVEISEKDLEKLQNAEPLFRELVRNKKYRVLNKLPESYVPAAVQVNNANAEADKYKAENEMLRAKIAKLEAERNAGATPAPENTDAEQAEAEAEAEQAEAEAEAEQAEAETPDYDKMNYKELQKAAKAKGIESNQSKADLIAALKDSE